MQTILVYALAAAALGGFESIWGAIICGIAVGVADALTIQYVDPLDGIEVVLPLAPGFLVGEAVALLSGVPRSTVRALVQSLAHDMVCHEDDVRCEVAPDHDFLSVDDAILRSLAGQTQATEPDGDVQGQATSDPAWVGTTR